MSTRCSKCQAENPDRGKFCAECGTPLSPIPEIQVAETLVLPTQKLTLGTVFAGRYQIIEELGKGGMGKIFRALDKKLNEEVAIKLIKPEVAADKKTLERFHNELKLARKISHVNIGRMYELLEDNGQHFITMEYVPGEDLKSFIRRSRRLTTETAIALTRQICEGLGEAHRLGVVHRDLKPSNIIIDKAGNAKIMDFGIARSLETEGLTIDGAIMGTPEYMSPEQVEGRETDRRSDLYALGVVLYEMVTGRLPFEGNTPFSIIYKLQNETPATPRSLNPLLPESLNRLILKCLEKDPSNRFQSAEEMAADLAKIEESVPLPERALPKRESITPREITVKFKPKKLFGPFLIAVLVLVVGFILWHSFLRSPAPLPAEAKNSVAVISFENQTGDTAFDYLQEAIPNLLITSLEQSNFIRIASWERLHDLLKQIKKEDQKVIDRDLGFELCRIDGIRAIILGSFIKAGNVFATDVKVLDVGTKQILNTVSSQGEGVDSILKKQIDELSRAIIKGLGREGHGPKVGPPPISEVTTTSFDAYNFFLRGREDYEKYYFDDARRFLERAVELDPEFAMAYSYLVRVYDNLGNAEAARGAIQKLQKYGSRVSGKEGLYIQAQLASYAEKNQEKYAQALARLVKEYPEEKRVLAELGNYYMLTQKYDEATSVLKEALRLDPQFGYALNILAYTYSYQNNFDEAIKYFKIYASISPADANPHDSIGELYFRQGNLEMALEKFNEAFRIKPDFGSSSRISYIHALNENYPEALEWIDKFIAAAPSNGDKSVGHQIKAIYHYLLGKVNLALDELDRARELAASENDYNKVNNILRVKIWVCYDWGKYGQFLVLARERFDYRAEHGLSTGLLNAALLLYYQAFGDLQENHPVEAKAKLDEIEKAMSQEKVPVALYWIKNTYYNLKCEFELQSGRANEALEAYKKIQLTPIVLSEVQTLLQNNIPLYHDMPARAHALGGRVEEAIAEYERLSSSDARARNFEVLNPLSRLRLAKLYEIKGERAKALAQYEKLSEIWKDADANLQPVEEAKRRQAALKLG